MTSASRFRMETIARLTLASALLWLACSEVQQDGDEDLRRAGLESQALQATSGGQWTFTGFLATARSEHTATSLPGGKVLAVGGRDTDSAPLASAEVYDPDTGRWSPTGPLAMSRYHHTATLLPDGRVLVSGGTGPDNALLASAEVYDPATEGWNSVTPLATPRLAHTATLLPDGRVLVSGGRSSSGPLASAEVYDPATGAWSPTGPLATARESHSATLLPSGKLLVTGGHGPSGHLASAEVYDPATGVWSPTGPLATARSGHTATLLPSGRVLVTGGANPSYASLTSAEVYEDTGARQEWRPVITPPAEQQPGGVFHITGSRLRGLSEASGGNTQNSATNLPLVSLLALEGGAQTRVTSLDSLSDTEVILRTPRVPNGYYILSVMNNAIHGGQMVRVNGPPLTTPTVIEPEDGAFINNPQPTIRGMAEPGSTVTVWLNGEDVPDTDIVVDDEGNWSFIPTTALDFGRHRVKVQVIDTFRNISPFSAEHSFAFQRSHYGWGCTTAPAAPITWALLLLALSLRGRRPGSPPRPGAPRSPCRWTGKRAVTRFTTAE